MSADDAAERERRRVARAAARATRGPGDVDERPAWAAAPSAAEHPAPAAPRVAGRAASATPQPVVECAAPATPPPVAARAASATPRRGRRWRIVAVATLAALLLVAAVAVAVGRRGDARDPSAAAKAGPPSSRVAGGPASAAGAAKPSAASASPGASGAATRPADALPSRASQQAALLKLAATGKPIFCGGHHGNLVALTFDDGPGPYTHYVLKRLRRNHMRATFFLVSRNLPTYGSLVDQERQLGTIADHTITHPNLPGLSHEGQVDEITTAQKALAAKSGDDVGLFRPPYGSRNEGVDAIASQHGLAEVIWDVDSADSAGANYAGIRENVINGLHAGAIVLMHDNRGQTVRALPPILHEITRRRLRAVTLPELLAADPPSAAQLRQGPAGCRHSAIAPLPQGLST